MSLISQCGDVKTKLIPLDNTLTKLNKIPESETIANFLHFETSHGYRRYRTYTSIVKKYLPLQISTCKYQ